MLSERTLKQRKRRRTNVYFLLLWQKYGKEEFRVSNYKDIDNTRYIISRVFAENKTPAMLITQRVLEEKNNSSELTENSNIMYNNTCGSTQSEEGL